jgi:hypothetical protein
MFIRQQGLDAPPDPKSESILYSALQFQPRLIGVLVLTGVGFQLPAIFLAVGAALLCSAIVPRWNPFNALYNYTLGAKRGWFLFRSAPPRVFAEAMAGCISAGIGVLLILGQRGGALALEAVFLMANAAAIFSRFCFGACLFYWLKNQGANYPDGIAARSNNCSRSAPV